MDEQRQQEPAQRLARLRNRREFSAPLETAIWGTPGARALRNLARPGTELRNHDDEAWHRLTPEEQDTARAELDGLEHYFLTRRPHNRGPA